MNWELAQTSEIILNSQFWKAKMLCGWIWKKQCWFVSGLENNPGM